MAQITALTSRLDLKSNSAREMFREGAEVSVAQKSPCVITVDLGKDLQYQLQFPAPVIQTRSKLRLARKSSYIEVVAPLASCGGSDPLQRFIYPMFPENSLPVNWNLPCLDLERLPVLDLAKKAKLQWLITHTSLMFSTRERALREKSMKENEGIYSDIRPHYKESLFSIFMTYSGVQGPKTRL